MSAPSVSTDFHPSPRWSPQPPATRSLCSGAWVPGIKLVSGAGRVARVLDELLVQVAHVDEDVSTGSCWEDDDTSEDWDDDAPLVLATTATTTVTVATNRAMTFSPVGDEFDPGLD